MSTSEKNDNDTNYHELRGEEGRKKIAELAKGIHICMMNTVGTDGSIHSRPMAVQDTPFDGTFWFLTREQSGKVDDIAQDQHITLAFAEPGSHKYIALKGKASTNQDRSKIKELWNPMYKAWFPGGQDDPQIAVVKVDVSEGDYWESTDGKIMFGFKYLAAAVTGGKMPVGDAGHVQV